METLRKDAVIEQESYADLQWISNQAVGKKEYIDYQITFYRNRTELLTRKIDALKYDLQTFLANNAMDPNYPVFAKVLNDVLMVDITPENGLTAVDIEKARSRNFPQETMQQVTKTLAGKYLYMLNTATDYIQKLYAARLEKARMANSLDQALTLSKDYRDNISAASTSINNSYQELKTAWENLNDLLRALIEFKYIFVVVPGNVTSQSAIDNHAANIHKYNVYYVGKKKYIAKMLYKLTVTFGELNHPDLSSDAFLSGLLVKMDIFSGSDAAIASGAEVLPEQYINAVDQKDVIIANINTFSEQVVGLINKVKDLMEAIRGTKGDIGNSDLKNMISISSQLAKSYTTSSTVSTQTVDQVINSNNISLDNISQQVETLKNTLQKGVDSLSDDFVKANTWVCANISNVVGYVAPFLKTGKQSLSDNVREKCRNSYGGNVMFCDEIKITDEHGIPKFVKKVDYDEKNHKMKLQVSAELLDKKNQRTKNILS